MTYDSLCYVSMQLHLWKLLDDEALRVSRPNGRLRKEGKRYCRTNTHKGQKEGGSREILCGIRFPFQARV